MAAPSYTSKFPSYSDDASSTGIRRREAPFVSAASIEERTRERSVAIDGAIMKLTDGTRYVLRDAVRVLGPSKGDADVLGLIGRTAPIAEFLAFGASVSSSHLRIGATEYDVELGYLVQSLSL